MSRNQRSRSTSRRGGGGSQRQRSQREPGLLDWTEDDETELQATVDELYEYLGYPEEKDATYSDVTDKTRNVNRTSSAHQQQHRSSSTQKNNRLSSCQERTTASAGSNGSRSRQSSQQQQHRESSKAKWLSSSHDSTSTTSDSLSPTTSPLEYSYTSSGRSSSTSLDLPSSPTSSGTSASTNPTRATPPIRYSVTELVATLNHQSDTSGLSPELERRVLDFRLAQQKRFEKYGPPHTCGMFGLYAHLSNVRMDLEWSEDAAWRRRHGHPYLSWSDFDAIQQKTVVRRPWFTYFVILLCIIMLIVEFGLNNWQIEPLSVNPLIGPSAQALIDAGARDTTLIVEDGQWFRLFSPLFLHAGLIHFGINMAALWFICGVIEQTHGILHAMILFFVPGIGGNILGAIFLPQYISVGASGGIFGLLGGVLADLTLNWKLLFIRGGGTNASTPTDTGGSNNRSDANHSVRRLYLMAIFWLVAELVINLVIGLTPYVDNFSHLGGLTYGLLCGWSVLVPLPVGFFGVSSTSWEKIRKFVVKFLGIILTAVMIIATTAVLATMNAGDPPPCPKCRYVSCVPFPFWTEHKWWYCDDCDFVTATLYKNPDGDEEYDLIEMTCPDGNIESIPLNGTAFGADKEAIRRSLPNYCREVCPSTT